MAEDEREIRLRMGKRIAIARGEKTQYEFADDLGISKSSLLRYEKGNGVPDIETVLKICALSNVSIDWLAKGKGPMRPSDQEESNDSRRPIIGIQSMPDPQRCMVDANGNITIPRWQNPDLEMFDYIPMAEAQLSAGGGCFVISEDMEGYYAFRKSWLHRVSTSARNLVLMRVNGDSMEPSVCANDTVMIDIGRRDIKEGAIHALRVDSTTIIKRLSLRVGGKVLVVSDNFSDNRPDLAAYEAGMQDLHIIGQVIFICRTLVPE